MPDIYDKTRLIVARLEGEKYPIVVGAVAESTWEVIDPEEWDRIKREMAEKWIGPDWTAYDYVEAVVTIPISDLVALFDAANLTATAVEKGE